jgi:hypothetical protein
MCSSSVYCSLILGLLLFSNFNQNWKIVTHFCNTTPISNQPHSVVLSLLCVATQINIGKLTSSFCCLVYVCQKFWCLVSKCWNVGWPLPFFRYLQWPSVWCQENWIMIKCTVWNKILVLWTLCLLQYYHDFSFIYCNADNPTYSTESFVLPGGMFPWYIRK